MMAPRRAARPIPPRMASGVPAAIPHAPATMTTEIVERTSSHARRFAAGLRAAGFQILNDVVINQVLVSFGSPERTLRTVARLQSEGTCWCGSTVWQGHTAMRISISSWATTEADVDLSLQAMLKAAAE